jgi:quinate dehydrogenase (quinone)
VQVGKAGQIFVLDRRTGEPITYVVERPVPQGDIPGERYSPTQPYSVGMPQVLPITISERSMWGATFFDQLACRIRFRQMRSEGQYTPPSLKETPITPGYYGGMNWGGVAVDPGRDMLIVNDIRVASLFRLVPRQEATESKLDFNHGGSALMVQAGTPYGVELKNFLSPLGIPCDQPPWGMITGIDLKSRRIAWQIPAGTLAQKAGNLIGWRAPIPIGMPTLSSAIATASGITFYAGTDDGYLRAWDTTTGRELWKDRLPVGSQATPMSYVSPATHRQYVVVVAGGAANSPNKGDYVIAYALSK